jgi:hypothetical protein
MEGIGDILYLLAMLAFFVFSAVMKSRKKKQAPSAYPTDEYTEKPNQEDDVLQELRDLFQPKSPTPAPSVREIPVQPVRQEAKTTIPSPSLKRTLKTIIPTEKRNVTIQIEEKEDGSYWDQEEFDLQKAIVFSEILKRPDY